MESLQQSLIVLFVLGLLGVTLFWLRKKGVASFGVAGMRMGSSAGRQLQSIERLALSPQHSLHLVRVAGKVVLIAVSPGGCSLLEHACGEMAIEDRTVTR